MAMPKFIECSLPAPLAYGAEGGPSFNTGIVTRGDGSEDRNANWGPEGRCHFRSTVQPSDKANFAAALSFYRVVQGKLVGFRMKDPTDSHTDNEHLDTSSGRVVGPSNTVPTSPIYQLRKKYSVNNDQYVFFRKIIKPVQGSVTLLIQRAGDPGVSVVTLAGGAVVGGGLYNEQLYNGYPTIVADVSIDWTTGVITWLSANPPGDNDLLFWTGDWEVPVRFASDDYFSRRAGHEAYTIDLEMIELAEADAYV